MARNVVMVRCVSWRIDGRPSFAKGTPLQEVPATNEHTTEPIDIELYGLGSTITIPVGARIIGDAPAPIFEHVP